MTDQSREAIPPQTADSPGPDSPRELSRTGRRDIRKRVLKKFKLDRCSMTAASLAYHWFLALFPALIAALGVIALVHIGSGTLTKLISGLKTALPPGASTVFTDAVTHATHASSGPSAAVLIASVLLALWSAIGG